MQDVGPGHPPLRTIVLAAPPARPTAPYSLREHTTPAASRTAGVARAYRCGLPRCRSPVSMVSMPRAPSTPLLGAFLNSQVSMVSMVSIISPSFLVVVTRRRGGGLLDGLASRLDRLARGGAARPGQRHGDVEKEERGRGRQGDGCRQRGGASPATRTGPGAVVQLWARLPPGPPIGTVHEPHGGGAGRRGGSPSGSERGLRTRTSAG